MLTFIPDETPIPPISFSLLFTIANGVLVFGVPEGIDTRTEWDRAD
ncbi:MAG: hypothetical protein ACTHMI_00735 [Mucilaginibacter sp.]